MRCHVSARFLSLPLFAHSQGFAERALAYLVLSAMSFAPTRSGPSASLRGLDRRATANGRRPGQVADCKEAVKRERGLLPHRVNDSDRKKIVWTGTDYFADSGKTLPIRDTNVNSLNTYADLGEVRSNGAKTSSVNCTRT